MLKVSDNRVNLETQKEGKNHLKLNKKASYEYLADRMDISGMYLADTKSTFTYCVTDEPKDCH